MKQVLIIDAPPMLKEFLKEKLIAEKVSVEIATGYRDALTKLLSIIPDLIILNVEESVDEIIEFLQKKKSDPNAGKIPIIMAGPVIERAEVSNLVQFGVIKYFTKPIKFDILFESIGKVLHAAFSIDTTPCVLDVHLNNNIIFIEIAMGLNREKISLLRYKLSEIIDANNLKLPKVILMMTDLSLSFVDGMNLELLLNNVTADPRILRKNFKILSLDSIVSEMVDGHTEYKGITVAKTLSEILNSIIDKPTDEPITDIISDNIITASDSENLGSIETRFYSDTGNADLATEVEAASLVQVAIIDDDIIVRDILQKTFSDRGLETTLFSSGAEFLAQSAKKHFDLLILDIFMPGLSGFDILRMLKERTFSIPVIIYSQDMQKDAIVQALSLGARSYILKPQKPEVLVQKALEVINANTRS